MEQLQKLQIVPSSFVLLADFQILLYNVGHSLIAYDFYSLVYYICQSRGTLTSFFYYSLMPRGIMELCS